MEVAEEELNQELEVVEVEETAGVQEEYRKHLNEHFLES